jgi:RimJ/RimL family protein N-acetyltransferase
MPGILPRRFARAAFFCALLPAHANRYERVSMEAALDDLSNWKGCARPERIVLEGQHVRLEPLDAKRHGDGLFVAATEGDADARFRWLPETKPKSREAFQPWLEKAEASPDPLFFTVVDLASGKVGGRQTIMRIDAPNGVAEIGNIHWGPLIQAKPGTTEALYLTALYLFDALGYRRFEWKCNNDNAPSKRAALRYGFEFEGIFRKHLVVKGLNRDTAWYAMTDDDWKVAKPAFEAWLDPSNFDGEGRQKRRLEDFRA